MKKLSKKQISLLIPHSGKMCLLHSVESWDAESITCCALSHSMPDNPLRMNNKLSASILIEYGAQAFAVHSQLIASSNKGGQLGFLASLKNIEIFEEFLCDDLAVLKVFGRRLFSKNGNFIYQMKISANDQVLLTGRATIMTEEIK